MSENHHHHTPEPSHRSHAPLEEDERTVADDLSEEPDDEATDQEAHHLAPRQRPSNPAPGQPLVPVRPINVLGIVAALLFFFGPGAAFVAGDRAEPIENRPLAEAPGLSSGWKFIPEAQLWANDHLPLRSQAVRIGTAISQGLFGEPPAYGGGSGGIDGGQGTGQGGQPESGKYPPVIEGADGTMFFGADIGNTCEPAMSLSVIEKQLSRIATAVQNSGRTFVLAVAPDKSTFESDKLPETFAGKTCMTERKDAFWKMLANQSAYPIVDPRQTLAKLEDSINEPIYKKYDTHWGLYGAYQFANDVAKALDPAVAAATTSRVVGEQQLDGDLSVLLGAPKKDTYADVRIERAGVSLTMDGKAIQPSEVPSLTASAQTTTASTNGAPVIAGKTLVLGDSFLEASRFMFPSYFAEFTYVHNQAIGEKPDSRRFRPRWRTLTRWSWR